MIEKYSLLPSAERVSVDSPHFLWAHWLQLLLQLTLLIIYRQYMQAWENSEKLSFVLATATISTSSRILGKISTGGLLVLFNSDVWFFSGWNHEGGFLTLQALNQVLQLDLVVWDRRRWLSSGRLWISYDLFLHRLLLSLLVHHMFSYESLRHTLIYALTSQSVSHGTEVVMVLTLPFAIEHSHLGVLYLEVVSLGLYLFNENARVFYCFLIYFYF
jgi:hypothetical protein